ncbi:MAG: GntR family transcriptional regulator [Myxococcales bacterium]|nr:GntR family transcriptional regulator [Myxococcales bacterium]
MQQTIVDHLTTQLACAILRGEHAPGSRLPTVRALATAHEVTAPTIQRVVAQLEALGLVDARQGSGTRVNDPREHGSVALLPYWLLAYADQPERAAALLADVLALRRDMALVMLERLRAHIDDNGLLAAGEALGALVQAAAAEPRDVQAIARADVALMKRLATLAGGIAHGALFNSVARVMLETPQLADAMYADVAANISAFRAVLAALTDRAADDDDDGARVRRVARAELEALDAATVAHFAKRLAR